MNSHITVPKCVLKQFALDKNGFYKYDVQTKIISRGYPRTTFTEEGYYSKTIEGVLCNTIETPLSKLFEYVKGFNNCSLPLTIPADILEVSTNYFRALIARSPTLCDSVKRDSFFFQFASQQAQHDMTLCYALQEEKMDELIDKFELTFMINETDTPFVLPIRGLYEFRINNVLCINIPLNPKCALMLKEKGKRIHLDIEEKNVITILPKGYDDVANKINSFAIQRQKQDGFGCVVCNIKDVLEGLV